MSGGGRVCRAVAAFLSEAASTVTRRPHELYELVLQACPSRRPNSSLGFSLLGVATVRSAVKVLGSQKMALPCKAAIVAYVSGALCFLGIC